VISITRHAARRLRAVFRRSVLGISHKGLIPPLVLHAEGQLLRAQYQYHDLSVEYVEPGGFRQLDSIPMPLGALADLESRDDSPVVLEAVEPDRTIVRSQDRGIPRTRDYAATPFGKIAPFPDAPAAWTSVPAETLTALAEAAAICTGESNRYSLDCIQLRSGDGKLIATDGRQLLVRSGLSFPWEGDLLIRGSPIFACKALSGGRAIEIGKTDTHVVLRIGPWTLWHAIQKDARFPRVEDAIPGPESATTSLQVDPEDARFVEAALDRLPGADALHGPMTIDCNGKVALRAKGSDADQATELLLSRSRYTGGPLRISTSREYVGRALALGFRELAFSNVEQPVVCREPRRIYAWQPLNADSAIEELPDVICIESNATTVVTNPIVTRPRPARSPMNDNARRNGEFTEPHPASNGKPVGDNPASSLAGLIQEAETLCVTLTNARASVTRLITGLRRHRKQSRLLSETLKSLRQLKLTETAE